MNPLRSLSAKISILTSLLALAVIAAMSRGVIDQVQNGLVGEMRVRAEFFARSAREAVFPKLDPFSLHFHVEEMVKEKAVTYAAVVDPDGRVLSHSDPKHIGEVLDDPVSRAAAASEGVLLQRRRAAAGDLAYDLAVPLKVGARRVGTARLGFDESSIQEALSAQKRRLLALAAAATAGAVLGTVMIVGWMTRPLPRLAAAAARIGQGDFDARVDWRSRDEVGALARAFNDMAAASAILFAAIKQEKEKLETVFSQTREGMVWTDPRGRVLLMNPAARALLGASEKEPADFAAAAAAFEARPEPAAILAGTSRITPFELTRKEPKLLILSGVADRLGSEKDPAGLLFVFHDATLEKRGEMLARNFLSLVSHKLRTPLAVALGYLEIVQSDKGIPEPARKALAKIRAEDEELRELVEKLIAFTLVQNPESIVLSRGPVRLAEVVDDALARRADLLAAPGVAVAWDPGASAGLPEVSADRTLVRDAVVNLLENAVKFNPAARKSVAVSVTAVPEGLRVSVRDDGPGIPGEEQPKLFRRFYQIDPDFTGQIPGFGLGLAFVKNVAEAHGGAAGLRSAPGEGSEFFFVLPRG
ncbi:MAG: HAMP domain-containing protein [Elusimicrobia bacterium]|nr:HAMP domain-containing protein [Elusimicrobiota bacterium]